MFSLGTNQLGRARSHVQRQVPMSSRQEAVAIRGVSRDFKQSKGSYGNDHARF